jgi:hypothetical protein
MREAAKPVCDERAVGRVRLLYLRRADDEAYSLHAASTPRVSGGPGQERPYATPSAEELAKFVACPDPRAKRAGSGVSKRLGAARCHARP